MTIVAAQLMMAGVGGGGGGGSNTPVGARKPIPLLSTYSAAASSNSLQLLQ
jgi:hypothetical protein